MLENIIAWVLNITQGLGYTGIALLMAIESSFLPLPSEVVIPPAAYLASQGRMTLLLVIIAGTLGSILGASFNYFLSRSLGRLVIYRLAASRAARYLLITPEKLARAEVYFLRNAGAATFLGRLLPVVRHLISIPAGFCRMPFGRFIFFTAIGSALWVSVLAGLGYFIGANQALIVRYSKEFSWGLLALIIIFIAWRIYLRRRSRRPLP